MAGDRSCSLTDADIDAWHERAETLLRRMVVLPAGAASSLAALDLVVREEDIGDHSIFGEYHLELIKAVRAYIASTAEVRS